MKNKDQNNQEAASVNYDLKSEAVEELLKAGTGDTPQYSKEELEKYRSGNKKFRIPDSVKILFIKAWFPGAVCFFFLWGLSAYVSNLWDMLFVMGIVHGMISDLLVNNIIRYMEKFPGQFEDWMLFPKKGMASFVLNLVFSCLIIYCVYYVYNVIGMIANSLGLVYYGVEPIMFGVFCMAFDMLFIGVKRLLVSIFRDARTAARSGGDQNRDETST